MTALEQKPSEISFQDAVNTIINNDFGGGKGLVEMEKKCYESVVDEMLGQQWNYLKSNFKFPNLFYTLILLLTFYFVVSNIPFAPFIIAFLLTTIVVVSILTLARYFYIGYFTLDTKNSIKDKIIARIASIPGMLIHPGIIFVWSFFLNRNTNKLNLLVTNHAVIVAIFISMFILYIISFIRLNRQEFKVYMIK
ncbi:hypothetical protein [Mucilaginibacter arboris]|uniref:Uncharacterized protein n=1 Tax=Mucilaginibacter arboris TaxID=2682090 RepID=A0A7K1STB8_9SPHI|nr:hypothetical protein [Mucilaginibacter arboris]MVN20552.1 hypothetical protein [Mucilaginibacter arboris]